MVTRSVVEFARSSVIACTTKPPTSALFMLGFKNRRESGRNVPSHFLNTTKTRKTEELLFSVLTRVAPYALVVLTFRAFPFFPNRSTENGCVLTRVRVYRQFRVKLLLFIGRVAPEVSSHLRRR